MDSDNREMPGRPRKELYRLSLPYPAVVCEAPNPTFARLLLEDFAVAVSELTAITQYIVGSFNTADHCPDVSKMMRGIAISEMMHLELLAGAIRALGEEIRYHVPSVCGNNPPRNWTPNYVDYSKTPSKILLEAISSERRAIDQYNAHIRRIGDEGITELITRIVMDEEYHLMILSALYQKQVAK